LLDGPLDFKHEGIWMAMLFSSALAVGLNLIYYKGGKWKKKHIFREKTANGQK